MFIVYIIQIILALIGCACFFGAGALAYRISTKPTEEGVNRIQEVAIAIAIASGLCFVVDLIVCACIYGA